MFQRKISTSLARARSVALVPASAAACALFLGGCHGVLIGNVVVLAVTFGIFFGTLGLGRTKTAESTRTQDPTASSESSSLT